MKGILKEESHGQTASKTFDYGQTTSFLSLLEQNGTQPNSTIKKKDFPTSGLGNKGKSLLFQALF